MKQHSPQTSIINPTHAADQITITKQLLNELPCAERLFRYLIRLAPSSRLPKHSFAAEIEIKNEKSSDPGFRSSPAEWVFHSRPGYRFSTVIRCRNYRNFCLLGFSNIRVQRFAPPGRGRGKQLYGSSASSNLPRNLGNRLIVPARSGIRRGAHEIPGPRTCILVGRRENFPTATLPIPARSGQPPPRRTRIAATYEVIPRNKFRKSTATQGPEFRNFPCCSNFFRAYATRTPPLPFYLSLFLPLLSHSRTSTHARSLLTRLSEKFRKILRM